MLLFKGRAIAANKNCKKILMISNVCISLCLACKIPRGIWRGCPRKNGEHNFPTFTDFLIIVQFWFFWFYPRALRGLSMSSVYSYPSRYNLLYGLQYGFWKREFNWSIDWSQRFKVEPCSRSLILTTIMRLVLNLIGHDLLLAKLKAY